ncbi:Uncharacterised protein [uncultured archaeon]|nr:Uncharacterised protein [uncultured archaeon]
MDKKILWFIALGIFVFLLIGIIYPNIISSHKNIIDLMVIICLVIYSAYMTSKKNF